LVIARRFNGGKTIKKKPFLAPQARAQRSGAPKVCPAHFEVIELEQHY
jgi:hypothetical protein